MTISPAPDQPTRSALAALAQRSRASKLSLALAVVGILIVASAVGFAAFFARSLYDGEINAIRNRLLIPAQTVAHGIEQIARNADLTLQALRATIRDDKSLAEQGPALRALLRERLDAQSSYQRIEIYDVTGRTIASSLTHPVASISVLDVPFFKRAVAAEADQLFVSELVRDPADAIVKIVLNRPIIDRKGVTRGVIVDYLDADYIQRLFDAPQMPPGSALVLFTREGRHLLRSPPVALDDTILNVDFSQHPTFRAFRDSGPDGLFQKFTTLAGGSERFVAGVGTSASPFVVTSGWDVEPALAHWRTIAAVIVGFAFAGIVIIAVLFAYLFIELRRNEALLVDVSHREKRFRALMAALPDAVLIMDQSLTITFANHAAENLLGYDRGELNGVALRQTMNAAARSDHEERALAALGGATFGEGVHALERLAIRKDGSGLPVEINARPYDTFEGRKLVAVLRDVSQRQANDRALRASRENLARAQRVAAVGSFERDLVTNQAAWSGEFLRIWGLPRAPDHANVGHLLDLVHSEDRAAFLAVREAALVGHVGPQPDFRIVRPDGEIRVLHNEYSVDRDADGKPLRLFGTVQDVTERTRIEDEVRRGRETLARAQRVASIGSFEHDLVEGKIEWSDQLYQLYGLDPQQHRGSIDAVMPMIHPDDRVKFMSVREQPANGVTTAAIDFRVTLRDGAQRIFHRERDVTFDGMGKPIRVFGVVQDVTERKNIEIELRRSKENLAQAQRLAGIGSFDHDLVTGKREVSDEFMRIWGLDSIPPGPLRETLRPLVHPEDRAKFHEMREAAFQKRTVPAWDFRIVCPDGAERIVHPETRVVFDAAGKPIRMYGIVQDITERKQIELELRRSREQLARAHQVAGIGSFSRDLVTGELEWSEEFLHIWGIDEKPTRGTAEQLLSLVHPEDREKFVDGRNAALERKTHPALDFRITRPDGQGRILHREYGVVFDDAGKPVRMFGTVQDITERKQIELELRRSRENLARAQRIAGMGSFDHDLITNRDEWSDELYRLYGLTPGQEGSKVDLVWSHIHPEDREKFVLFREEATKGIRSMASDYRIIRTDGAERIFHRECDIVFDESGKPIRIFGTVQDVTERKKAESELLRGRENLARAQRFAGMGSFERDLITNQGEWSEEMYHILGVDTANAVPGYEQQLKFIHLDDRKAFLDYRTAEIRGEPSRPIEYRIIRPDGAERIVRRESAVAFDEDKRAIRIYGTLQDVTERRLAERRERELERQLLHSQKLEALGTLAGGIAHDLNNTLVPIMALSKLTSRRFEAGSLVQSNLETIYEASVRARDLVKRVVAFSRKDESEKRNTDISEVVDEALKLLRATVPSSIALETRIAKVPPIPADPSQIHQVVTNLVANASHAIGTEMGKVTVTLDLRTPAAQAAEICLSVSDTGAGMDATTQERIFEPFFTTKPVGQGTGLGLSIVHGIVTGHNGRIEMKSAPGEGTRFDLYFPVPAGSALTSSRPAA